MQFIRKGLTIEIIIHNHTTMDIKLANGTDISSNMNSLKLHQLKVSTK